jgi:hypothetical protein
MKGRDEGGRMRDEEKPGAGSEEARDERHYRTNIPTPDDFDHTRLG